MKKALSLLLMFAMVFALCACGTGAGKGDYTLEGTYAYAHVYQGTEIVNLITLRPDDSYQKLVIKDDYISSCEVGDYELVDGKVKLYDADAITYHGVATVYSFKDGCLNGPETVYAKISED